MGRSKVARADSDIEDMSGSEEEFAPKPKASIQSTGSCGRHASPSFLNPLACTMTVAAASQQNT